MGFKQKNKWEKIERFIITNPKKKTWDVNCFHCRKALYGTKGDPIPNYCQDCLNAGYPLHSKP